MSIYWPESSWTVTILYLGYQPSTGRYRRGYQPVSWLPIGNQMFAKLLPIGVHQSAGIVMDGNHLISWLPTDNQLITKRLPTGVHRLADIIVDTNQYHRRDEGYN